MKNVLVISNDFEFYKTLNNEYYDKIRIINISSSYEEGIKNMGLKRPDIIILKIRIQYYKMINLINKIKELIDYHPLIILVSNTNMYDIQLKYKKCFIIREDEKIIVFNNIFQYISCFKEDDNIDEKIKKEMLKMGFEMKNKGDNLILNVTKYIKQNKIIGTNLERDIYPKIAIITNISEKQIKWNINYSINSVYDSKHDVMCRYFNINTYEKPTSKFIISTLLNKL